MSKIYKIPDNLRVYAIGDIHGYPGKLEEMHEAIMMDLLDEPPAETHIVYIGDYIDRGPNSKAVIDILIERRDRGDGVPKTFLMGNHELAMLRYMDGDGGGVEWLEWGGMETLKSYGLEFEHKILLPGEKERAAAELAVKFPPAHLAFIEELEPSLQIGDYFFAHAGIDPAKGLKDQALEDLCFMREPFLSWDKGLDVKVVHGHTVSKVPENLEHRIGIDTGIYMAGPLTCAVLQGEDVRFLQA